MVWFAEPPTEPHSSTATVLIAEVNTNQLMARNNAAKKRVIGACEIVNGAGQSVNAVGQPYIPRGEIFFEGTASTYMSYFENRIVQFNSQDSKTTITQPPKHGRYEQGYYYPDKGYYGRDEIVAEVSNGDLVVEVRYFIVILEEYVSSSDEPYNTYCLGDGGVWKIS
ncbi:hypothetical protein JCM14076_31200 [Methylosoma difficile]